MRILLADDHVLFRDALAQFIYALRPQWMVTKVASFHDAYNKINEKGADYFDILLLDVRMPGMNGLEGLKIMRTDFPDLKTAIISGIAREIQVRRAMHMGAAAYFPKTLPGKSLINAIHLVVNGEKFVPVDEDGNNIMPSYYDDAVSEQDNEHPSVLQSLTHRERQVATCLAQGASNRDIADQLSITIATVKLHVSNLCRKLDVRTRTQAALAIQKSASAQHNVFVIEA